MADRISVVIVDDIAETREHLAKLLSFESDINVIGSVSSGPEAIALAGDKAVDVVLLDINMPGMDGIETAEQLAIKAPTSAIIMMSVQGEPDYLRRAMLAGAREFLVKPFSSDELAASIARSTSVSARSSTALRVRCRRCPRPAPSPLSVTARARSSASSHPRV